MEEAALGSNGILSGIRAGSTYIDMSAISSIVTRKIAEIAARKGVGMLDAPVSGGENGAREGTLTMLASLFFKHWVKTSYTVEELVPVRPSRLAIRS